MQVFMRTNEFNNDPKYSSSATFEVEPTADSFALIGSATRAAHSLWRDDFRKPVAVLHKPYPGYIMRGLLSPIETVLLLAKRG